MKRPISNYLKLLRKFLSTDTIEKVRDNSDISDWYVKQYESDKIVIVEECTRYNGIHKSYTVMYSTGSVSFYYDNCKISLSTFAKKQYNLLISIDIDGKDEFFNYMMNNNVDYITYEDVEVLKEIKNLTIKITEKETING